jgi:hypothetical protein
MISPIVVLMYAHVICTQGVHCVEQARSTSATFLSDGESAMLRWQQL